MSGQAGAPFQKHLEDLSRPMKGQPFWKTALFGTVLLERQWPVYERLAVGRDWGAAKEVRKVMDRLWQAIPTGVRLHEKYLLMLEEHPVAPITAPWDETAARTIRDGLNLLRVFWEKDKKAAPDLAGRNLEFITQFLQAAGEDPAPGHPLLEGELAFQRALCTRLCAAGNGEKAELIARLRGEGHGSILAGYWFPGCPDYAPRRRRAKQEPALRYASPKYEDWAREQRKADAWALEQEALRLFDLWLSWPGGPDGCTEEAGIVRHALKRWPMPEGLADFYSFLGLHLTLAAQSCWACAEDAEQVRGLVWGSARAQEVLRPTGPGVALLGLSGPPQQHVQAAHLDGGAGPCRRGLGAGGAGAGAGSETRESAERTRGLDRRGGGPDLAFPPPRGGRTGRGAAPGVAGGRRGSPRSGAAPGRGRRGPCRIRGG